MADDSFISNWNHSLNLQPGGGGTSDAWSAQILRRQEAAIKAAEDGEKDYPSASVGSVADKGADSIPRPTRLPSWTAWTCQMQKNWPMWASPWIPN